jgi:hypothetical protein
VKTKYVKPVEVITKSEGKKRNETARINLPDVKPIMDIPYSKIMNDKILVIEMK